MPILPSTQQANLPDAATGIKQTIQARHGIATYVPKGHTIKVINTYGRQVVDLWGFALHGAPTRDEMEQDAEEEEKLEAELAEAEHNVREQGVEDSGIVVEHELGGREQQHKEAEESGVLVEEGNTQTMGEKEDEDTHEKATSQDISSEKAEDIPLPSSSQELDIVEEKSGESSDVQTQMSKSWASYIPSISEKLRKPATEGDQAGPSQDGSQRKTWGSYLPSIRGSKGKEKAEDDKEPRTWSSYIPSGTAFSSYIPKGALSSIAALHQRDPSKSVAEQLYDFSKTPVGAVGLSSKFTIISLSSHLIANSGNRIWVRKLGLCSLCGLQPKSSFTRRR
jgi:hypothetical protein